MRDYGIVSPKFWIGETGKQLRGDSVSQVVAVYLMTSPHANMTGVFHCPLLYICHETGSPIKGASKALRRLCEVGFCEYEEASETIFVVRMAAYQIAEQLQPSDKRVSGLRKEVEKMTSTRLKQRFLEVYGRPFHLVSDDWKPAESPSPSEAPSKPLRSQDQDQKQDQDQEHDQEQDQEGRGAKRATRIPDDFELTHERIEYASSRGVDPQPTFEAFTAYWRNKPKDATKLDWNLTWHSWVLKDAKDTKVRNAPKPTRYDQIQGMRGNGH